MLFHIHEFILKIQKGEVDNGEDPLNNCSQQLADKEKFEAFPASNRRSEPSACNSKDDAKVARNDCTHLVAGNKDMEAFPAANRRFLPAQVRKLEKLDATISHIQLQATIGVKKTARMHEATPTSNFPKGMFLNRQLQAAKMSKADKKTII